MVNFEFESFLKAVMQDLPNLIGFSTLRMRVLFDTRVDGLKGVRTGQHLTVVGNLSMCVSALTPPMSNLCHSYRQLNCPLDRTAVAVAALMRVVGESDGACDVNSAATPICSRSPPSSSSILPGTLTAKEIAFPEPMAVEIRSNFAP